MLGSNRRDGYLPLSFGGAPHKTKVHGRSRFWILLGLAVVGSFIFIGAITSSKDRQHDSRSITQLPYHIFGAGSGPSDGYIPGVQEAPENRCQLDPKSLAHLNLTASISYARRYVRQLPYEQGPHANSRDPSLIEEVGEGLFKQVEGVDLVNARSLVVGHSRTSSSDEVLAAPGVKTPVESDDSGSSSNNKGYSNKIKGGPDAAFSSGDSGSDDSISNDIREADKGQLRESSQSTRLRATPKNTSHQKVELRHCFDQTLSLYTKQNFDPVDARHLMFGVASTAERLLELAPTMATWLAHTGARLISIVPDSEKVAQLQEVFEALGIDNVVLLSNEPYLKNYFKLVEAFYIHADAATRWVTFLDDDTHYFSLRRFVQMLEKYDAGREHYVGGVSEDFRQMRGPGIYAFGGAGVSLSIPLLEKMHWNYPHCQGILSPDPNTPGDLRLAKCIYFHTATKLSMETDIHQVDLLGDTAGILEGPSPPISFHHYRSWSPHDVLRTTKAGKLCGGSCLFQRWKFTRPVAGYAFTTLHLGFSIVRYAVGVFPDMARTERTWATFPESIFDHALPPLRDPLVEGVDRFTYRLEGSGDEADGVFRQTYVRRAASETENDSVLELFWI